MRPGSARRQTRGSAPAVPPADTDPPSPSTLRTAWDDDGTDPLLDHVLQILFPRQSMFERVQESLRHSGYDEFEHLYTLTKASLLELTYSDPDSHNGRTPLPIGNRK